LPSSVDNGLFSGVRHKPAVNHIPAELPLAAVVEPLHGPMALCIADALTDAVALIFSNSRQDREDQLADAISGHVAAEIYEVQADLFPLQILECFKRVGGKRNARSSLAATTTSPVWSAPRSR
jgi:hypothetical protein